MHVADKVKHELQRQKPLRRRRCGIPQLRCELVDLVHDAVLGRPLARRMRRGRGEPGARRGEVGLVDLDVHEVPGRRLPVAEPVLVRPRGAAGDVGGREVVAVAGEQAIDLMPRGGRQMAVGDQGDDFVAEIPPRERRAGGGDEDPGQKKGGACVRKISIASPAMPTMVDPTLRAMEGMLKLVGATRATMKHMVWAVAVPGVGRLLDGRDERWGRQSHGERARRADPAEGAHRRRPHGRDRL